MGLAGCSLIGCFLVCMAGWLVRWLVVSSVGWLVDWVAAWLVFCSVGWLIGWLPG